MNWNYWLLSGLWIIFGIMFMEQFEIVSDHRAPLSVLKSIRGNKTFSRRLKRWVDRCLPFQFKISHAPGRTMGLADCMCVTLRPLLFQTTLLKLFGVTGSRLI